MKDKLADIKTNGGTPPQSKEFTLPFPLARDRTSEYFVPDEPVIYFYFIAGRVFCKTGKIVGTPNGSVVMRGDRPFNYRALDEDAARNIGLETTSHQLLKHRDAMMLKDPKLAAIWFNGIYSGQVIKKIVSEFRLPGFGIPERIAWTPFVIKTPRPMTVHKERR